MLTARGIIELLGTLFPRIRMNTSKASTVLNTIMRSLQNDHHVPQNLNNFELPEDITLHAISVFRSCRGECLDFDLLRRVYEHRYALDAGSMPARVNVRLMSQRGSYSPR